MAEAEAGVPVIVVAAVVVVAVDRDAAAVGIEDRRATECSTKMGVVEVEAMEVDRA